MKLLRALLKGIARMVTAVMLFVSIGLVYGVLLYLWVPWSAAAPDAWPLQRPIAVSSAASGQTRVILYRNLAHEMQNDPTLVPWPGTSAGIGQMGEAKTEWKTVEGQSWQFEVSWDDRDRLLQSRYRLEGERPVLVETRGRDPAIAFQSIALTALTLLVWKLTAWWRQRRVTKAETRKK